MQPRVHELDEFIALWKKTDGILMDVRSSGEYLKAHIPSALSLPLMDNEHRVIIGTTYKQQGRQAAVLKGFELIGPRFHEIITEALKLAGEKEVFLYCWRGGMRSNITAWLLQMAGMKVHLLKGGYKTFRHWVLEQFQIQRTILVLGGSTGSGKTEMLELLKARKEQVVDLEAIANHRGSAYGPLGLPPQPSQEKFENLLATALAATNPAERLWLENESRAIGKITLPNQIYDMIRYSPMVEMQVPIAVRKDRILAEYGVFSKDELAEKTSNIERRLGGQHMKAALEHLEAGEMSSWLDIILKYYDKTYDFGTSQRQKEKVFHIAIQWSEKNVEVQKVLNTANKSGS